MTRLKDVLPGTIIGSLTTGAIVAIAAAPTMDPVKLSPQYVKAALWVQRHLTIGRGGP
jgi:hypothetical protein